MVTIFYIKTNYIFIFKLSFTMAKYITKKHSKSGRLMIIKKISILLIIIKIFSKNRY